MLSYVIFQQHWCKRRTVSGLFLLVPSLSTVPPPPSLLSSPGCSCICVPGEDYKELLCEGMQLLKSDEIQLKRREQVGQQRHPTVPRISGCRAVPPSSNTPPPMHARTIAHPQGAPPTSPRHTHKQTCKYKYK